MATNLFDAAPDVESALTGDQPLFESAPDLANGLPDGGNLFDAAPNLPDSNPIPDEPVSDWLGIGEEVSGLGNSLARGAVNFAQQQNLNALRRQRDIPGEIAKIDAELKQAEDYLASRVPHPGIAAKGFVTAGEEADYRRSMQRTLGDAARRKIGLQQELARLEQSAPNIKREFQSNQELLEALPYTEAQREFQKKETPWWKFFQNPVELTATTTLESAPVMAQTMAAAPLGPGGVVLVAGGSSFGAESSARVLAKMQEDGVDLKNPESVVAWLADRAKSDPALAKADLAALGPATFDALSGGIAGRWLKGATGRGTKPLVGAMAKESGAQMLAGGAGSIAGNKLAGEAVDWKDVVLEMAAEVAPVEAVSNVAAEHGFGLDQIVSQRAENKAFDAASAQAAQEAALQGTLPVRNGKLTQNRAADFSFEKGKLFESAPNVESSEAQPQKPETQNQNSRPAGTAAPATPPDASAQVRAELEALPGAQEDLARPMARLTTEQTDAGLYETAEDDAPVTKGDLRALVDFFQNGGPNPFANETKPKPTNAQGNEPNLQANPAQPAAGNGQEMAQAQVLPQAPQGDAPSRPPPFQYESSESKAWWEKKDQLDAEFKATTPGSPERAAARKARNEHEDLAFGENGNRRLAARRIDASAPLKEVGNVRQTQYSGTNITATDLTGWRFDGEWQTDEDGREFRKVVGPNGEKAVVDRSLHPLQESALSDATIKQMPGGAAVTAEVTDGAPIPANGQEAATVNPPANHVNANPKELEQRKSAAWDEVQKLRKRLQKAPKNQSVQMALQKAQKAHAAAVRAWKKATGQAIATGTRAAKVFAAEEEMGGEDILSFIIEQGGLVSKSSAKRQRGSEWWKLNASLYDDAAKLARPHHNVIYSDSGQYPDQIAQAAYDARVIKEPTVNALWAAIKAASAKRGNAYQLQREQNAQLETQSKFASATAQGDMAVTAEDLKPGDTFEVDGEPFKVKRVDPTTGEVTLDDGKVFGRQYLSAGQQIWVEQPSDGLTERIADADGGAQFAAGESQKIQFARVPGKWGAQKVFVDGKHRGDVTVDFKARTATLTVDGKTMSLPSIEAAQSPVEFVRRMLAQSALPNRGEEFSFDAPESVAEQKARERREKQQADTKAAKESMLERAGARLVAGEDTRTGDMFSSPEGRSTRQDKAGQGSLFAAGAVMPPKFALNNPIKGPTGASIVGYEWRSTIGEKFSAREGGMVEARVSDWDNADESTGTGRAIVHVFYVAHPDGTVKPEGIRSAQNVLGISETRLMTIAKKERAAQQYRQDQERAEMASYDKASASTAQEAARDYRKWNYSPMRTFEENNEAFNESALFEKDGKFIRRNWKTAERMQRNGWTLIKDDPARTSGTTKAIDSVRAPEPEKQLDRGRLNQGSLFKAGSKATGTPRAQIQNVVAGLQREMPKAAPTTVVNTPEELPAAVQSAAAKQGVRLAGVKGLLLGNRVYLVASNLANPAEAQSIWLHEQVGHFATDAQLGAELRDFMGQVHDSFKGSQLMADVRARYPKADRVTLGREVVARLAEAGDTNPGAFKRLLAMFRAWLRKLGLVRQVSENDLRVMLQRAAESLRGGDVDSGVQSKAKNGVLEAGNATLVAPWARGEFALTAYHGTPHKVDKFTTAKIGTGEGAQVYGWGLYFAENREVAKQYRNQMAGRPMRGEESVQRQELEPAEKTAFDALQRFRGDYEKAIEFIGDNFEVTGEEAKRLLTSREIGFSEGAEYTVSLNVEPEELLDWDKPLSGQSEKVKAVMERLGFDRDSHRGWGYSGEEIYHYLYGYRDQENMPHAVRRQSDPKKVSENLASLGIKGIRFLDQGSRNILPEAWLVTWRDGRTPTRFANQQQAQDFLDGNKARGAVGIKPDVRPTYNYVIFNDEDITITHENGKPVSVAEAVPGQAEFAAGQDSGIAEGVASPAFKKWFGNSKVTQLVYHSSPEKFNVFDTSAEGAHFGTHEQASNLRKPGKRAPQAYWLSIQNPLRLPDLGVWSNFQNVHAYLSRENIITDAEADRAFDEFRFTDERGWKALKDILRAKGYDGIVYENEVEGQGESYIAFEANQIKSAKNKGTFDPETDDIRFAAGEAEQSEFAKLQADITAAEAELMTAIRQTTLPPDQRTGTRADVFAAKNDAHRKLRDLLAKQLKMMTDIRNLDAARSPEETANLISQTVDLLNSIQDEISERNAKSEAIGPDLLKLRTDLQERLMMLKGWTDDQSEAGRANVPKETEAGRARFLALESATDPQHKTFGEWWQTIKNGLRYLTSPIPELPLTGERAEKSALFRRGYRLFAVENNRVRKEAAELVNEVLEPLTKLGRTPASNEALRRYYKLGEARERAAMDPARRDALAKEMLALEESTLNKDPFNLFRRLVLYKDLRWRGTYLKNEQGKPITLPMGLTVDEVASELRRTYKLIEQHPDGLAITEALRRHYKLTDDLQKSILEHGEIIPESLRNPLYFPHHVIDSWSGNIARVRPSTEEDFRKYLIAPTGSAKLIQTDYLKAMYLHTADVLAHNARVDLVDKYWKPYDISEQLKAQHGDKWNLPWNIPPGYKVFTPFNKLPLRMDYVLSREVLADKLGVLFNDGDLRERMGDTGKVLKVKPEDLHAAMVAGEKIQWVLPAEIADALTGIARREAAASNPGLGHAIGLPFRAVNNFWKKTKLFAPWNWVRYEYGNLSTDAIDKVLAADPGAAKHLARAAREIWTADTGEQSPEYQAAQREGVFDTITAGEAGELTKLPEFKAFLTGSEARWEKVRSFLERPMRGSKFREAVFRYAKFLADVERLRSGKEPVYAGAFHGDIEALGEDVDGQRRMLEGDELIYAKAAEISLKTYGDYNSLGVAGQLLRRYAVPFWSWQDVNFRYHANQLRNIADGLLGKTGPELNTARKAALRYAGVRVVSTLLAIGIAKELWNQFGGPMLGLWDDDDDLEAKLSEADRRRGHLIVGKDKDGKVLVVYTPSAWSDVAEWMGGQNMKRLFMEYVRGQITLDQFVKDYAKQMPADVINKIAQSVGPLGKGLYEPLSGKSTFPDVLDQRTIPESERWWRLVGTLTDDRAVNVLRGAFDQDYYSQPAAEQLQQIILQIRRRDPEQWSYYEAREDAADWKEARTGKRFEQGSYDAPEAQALRNFRKSIYRGDVASAERFYGRLLQFGYTAERLDASIRNQHPLSDLNETERAEYIKTLSQKQRQELELATKYYNRIKALDGRERQLFPRKGQKPNPRPELLKQIVEGQSRKK